ncbi:unnamed protein product [Acanthoscelides obtectus]|uniref:Hcy-binding domain-containing protein n=1 Tax=Acanthoscelides obtectus TaxID=200917 RepID=A0A9P0LWN7_ACAOB|nr:unnamed protein product [Acanthoscelides obtectus]CAK1651413.1 hypothetical protein AOBTE_LOCUS17252 [Acanthoscelides obtectus]
MAPPGIGSSSQPYYPETEQVPNRKITVLDGGFATQLSCHVNDPIDGDVLWSSRFIATNPEAVIKAHLDFLRAIKQGNNGKRSPREGLPPEQKCMSVNSYNRQALHTAL